MNKTIKDIYTIILLRKIEMTSDISIDGTVLWIYDVGNKDIEIMFGFELRK